MIPLSLHLFLTAAGGAAAPQGEQRWLRQLLPLPKEVAIRGEVAVPAAEVGLQGIGEPGELTQAAVQELQALFAEKAGVKALTGKGFVLRLGLCDAGGRLAGALVAGAEGLGKLPNREQAYAIAPTGQRQLTLTALDERGLYYACKTLQQLLRPHFGKGKVTLPLVTIRDWPDLAERGEWGGSSTSDIAWLAERKMNLVEAHVKMSLDEAGRGVAKVDERLLALGRTHGLKLVPIVTHLDQLSGSGIYERFPELKGVGKSAKGTWSADQIAACFSQPKTVELIADWFSSLASQTGVRDICVWLSEEHLQCGCGKCAPKGQYVLETEAAVNAWRLAREKHPNVRLRILLTQGSYADNGKVLATVPPEVGITYYDGGRTYDSSRDPMIYPLLADYAAKGRWLGCYPQLDASWRIVCPWSGPQFIRARMTEFVQKRLQCLCGYATPNNRLYDFNVQAAAEWSWNSTGRDEREFAAAWASREGLKAPEKAADWAVMLGPVGWDVYGSGVPYPWFFGGAHQMVAKRQAPKLGERLFRYFPKAEHFDEDLAVCDRALTPARELEAPGLIAETETIRGYVAMLKSIWEIASGVSGKQSLTEDEKRRVQESVNRLDAAAEATVQALQAWEASVGPGLGGGRFTDTVRVTEQTSADIAKALAPLGITDPSGPFRRHKVGVWTDDDFRPGKERITKRWEVTEALSGEGEYQVRFDYTQGWWGLTMHRVALVSAPAANPDQTTEVSVDQHEGAAAYTNKLNLYALPLTKHDPAARYFLVADIQGVTSEGKPENRRGCWGEVWMHRLRPARANR